jgi:hypothetical protein
MTDKKRFEVQVYLPDCCVCTEETLKRDIDCNGGDGAPTLVYVTLSTPSLADARRFAHNRFPDAIKIHVRAL